MPFKRRIAYLFSLYCDIMQSTTPVNGIIPYCCYAYFLFVGHMDFERLREFFLAAKCGSIKDAAELLGISPATLGARLHVLEHTLGVSLFAHAGRRIRLTPEGERLLPYAADILRRYDSVTGEVKAIRYHHYRQLRIGISGEWPLFHIGPFLDKINLMHPQVELSLYDDQAMPLLDALCRNELDICFASILESADLAGMTRVPISTCNPCIILPRAHPFNLRGSLSLRELEGETFLLYPPTDALGTRCFQLANLSARGIRHSTYELAWFPHVSQALRSHRQGDPAASLATVLSAAQRG